MLTAVAAACQPFGSPGDDDYVIFRNCPVTTCAAGEENILLMRSPQTTVDGSRTTMTGKLELRLRGRTGTFDDHEFPDATVVVDAANPSQSSIEVGSSTGVPPTDGWNDFLGIDGLNLSGVTLHGYQDAAHDWTVSLRAASAAFTEAPAQALLPPLLPLSTTFSAAISDPGIPVKAGVHLANIDLGGIHFGSFDLFKESWADHSQVTAAISEASGRLGPVTLSEVTATAEFDQAFNGEVHVSAIAASSGMSLPIDVDFPVHAAGGSLVAGPDASIAIGSAPNQVSLTGTFEVPLGGIFTGQGNLVIADAVLGWGSTQIPVQAQVANGPNGLEVDLHAGTAQLTPGVRLNDAHLTWRANTLTVDAEAQLTGVTATGSVQVTGTATMSNGTPSVDLTVTAPHLEWSLPGGSNRSIAIDDASFHLTGNFQGGTVSLTAGQFSIPAGVFGNNAVTGNLDLSGQIALGANFAVTGWRFDVATAVRLGAIDTSASIHGSGGSLYDGVTGANAEVTGVLSIIDPGRGLGGVLRATLWLDDQGRLHLDGTGNAHVTLGSKVVIDGTVTVTDNVLTVNANAKLGTSITVPISGTITVDTANPTAVPTVDLTAVRIHVSQTVYFEQVHLTNSSNLTTFTLTGHIGVASPILDLLGLDDFDIAGTVNLASGDLNSATAGNITYDLQLTIPTGNPVPSILRLFVISRSSFNLHAWGDSHGLTIDLGAQAVFGANLGIISGGAAGRLDVDGTLDFDTGAVGINGHAGAMVFAQAFGLVDAEGAATIDVSLTGNLNSTLTLAANGTGWAGANFIGIPVASGDINLGGSVVITPSTGAVTGTAFANWSIDVVGGVFGNHDGDWKYNVSGTTSNPVVTAHDSYWRDNHWRAKDISGQVMPVKNLCGTYQHKGTFELNWHTEGTWGDCNSYAFVGGTLMLDVDRSNSLTGSDTAFPSSVSVTLTDASDGNELVGQTTTATDGSWGAGVVVRPGHKYVVNYALPSGYKIKPGSAGFATVAQTAYVGGEWVYEIDSPTAANQTVDAGVFGSRQIIWRSLTGSVFGDTDGDGVRDPGESGLAGVTMTVSTVGEPDRTAVTDVSGHYDMNLLDSDLPVTVKVDYQQSFQIIS
ncbi:MAG: hypothetical protein KDB69_06215, partial [Acidimicrobiia bacterium]|nr:hypothetical protein [Acidimicrobiia bacterium]